MGGYGLSRRKAAAMDSGKCRLGIGNSEEATALGLVSRRCRTAADARLYSLKKKMGGGTHLRLVGTKSAALERLRVFAKKQRNDDLSGNEQFDAPAIDSESTVWRSEQAKAGVKALKNQLLKQPLDSGTSQADEKERVQRR